MTHNSGKNGSARGCIETLEGRTFLSASVSGAGPIVEFGVTAFTVKAAKPAATKTTLTASAGTLGQPITFGVTVRAAAAAGAPTGTVEIVVQKTVLATATLVPAVSTNPKDAVSDAAYTLDQTVGGSAYFFGKHAASAIYLPTGKFAKSGGAGSFTVAKPTYTTLGDGVKYETIATGSGPAITVGQIANVFYTGYLAKNGRIFDDSIDDGGDTFSFPVGGGDVITGFDQGTQGMEVGETRIVDIPPADGYGATTNGPIPKNSTLIFVLTLESIT